MTKILITGATGRVGGALLTGLLEHRVAVRALVRDPSKLKRPVETAIGDLADPASLASALDGIDAVFLYAQGTKSADLSRVLRDSAVKQVVVLSTIDAASECAYAQDNRRRHLAFEQAAAEAVPRTTMLRPGAFASNALRFWQAGVARGVIRLPFPAAQQAPIDELDIAAVAQRALTSRDLDGRAIVLTGPRSLSQREQVACLAAALGRSIEVEQVTVDEARADLARIIPPAYVELLLAQWADEVAHPALVTDEVMRITHRSATSYEQWAARNAGRFT